MREAASRPYARWQNCVSPENAKDTQIFSGGSCAVINERGEISRNPTRDTLNDWIDQKGILFFEPQIDQTTHGRSYVYEIDGPVEQAAREAARVLIYDIRNDTMAGVSCMEALRDALRGKDVILYFSSQGDTTFKPRGINAEAQPVHAKQFEKNGIQIRKNFLDFVKGLSNVKIVSGPDKVDEAGYETVYSIEPNQMNADKIIAALRDALTGKNILVKFEGQPTDFDDQGRQKFTPRGELDDNLKSYQQAGDSMRKVLLAAIGSLPNVKVVSDEESVKLAVGQFLKKE